MTRRASADPELAAANVVIRPHPMNFVCYDALDLADLGPVAVAPLHGGLPVTEEARATYFDCLGAIQWCRPLKAPMLR